MTKTAAPVGVPFLVGRNEERAAPAALGAE